MAWFKRKEKGITTATEDKKDVPKGLWYKSPTGKIVDTDELARNLWVSPEDDFHVRIGSKEYFEILFDNNEFKELDANLTSKDPLKFEDTKKYSDRLKDVMDKTKLKDMDITVSSLRVDLILSDIFILSRNEVKQKIQNGDLYVNSKKMFFPAYTVKENDIVSFKRCGKIKIGKVLRHTKSGKIVVNVKKYI